MTSDGYIRAEKRPRWLGIAGFSIAIFVAAPTVSLCVSALVARSTSEAFGLDTLLRYLANSLWVSGGAGALAAVIGIACAWLVTMCEFPGRRLFEWALVLPLAAPAYIIAYAYSDFLQHAGPVQTMLREVMHWGPRDYWFPNIRSLPGAILVLGLVLYPYVYLLTRAALLEQNVAVLEASRSLGRTPWQSFWGVALPLARPAIVAGVSLVIMETLADFGTVAHFGVQTLTTAIYQAYSYLGNQMIAAELALVLLVTVLALLWLERAERGRALTRSTGKAQRALPRFKLTKLTVLVAVAACALPICLGAVLPAGILIELAAQFGQNIFTQRYLELLQHTLTLGFVGAAATIAAAILIAFAVRATQNRQARAAMSLSVFGYAVPGPVIAIGILVPLAALDNAIFSAAQNLFGVRTGLILTGSIVALTYAYIVRFLTIGFRSAEQSLARITPHMDAAARTLGVSEGGLLTRVHLPMMRGSLLSAGLLIFIEIVKELPATLILRPFNYDTLAIQAYRLASDERLPEASSAALVIFAVSLISVFSLTRSIARSRVSSRDALESIEPPQVSARAYL